MEEWIFNEQADWLLINNFSMSPYGRIRNTPAANTFFNVISLPSSIYEALVQVQYGEACSPGINGEPEYCEQTISFVGVLPNPIAAVAITWTVMAIYWYLLACIIVWLLSLRKKQPPQTPPQK